MSHELILQHVRSFVQETIQFLLSRVTYDRQTDPPSAGWHNFFKPGRIGTTGSAVPLLFLHERKIDFPHHDEVVNGLLSSQFAEGPWAILSLGSVPTVEGTAWPLRALSLAGGSRSRDAVMKAEAWLLSQQDHRGGWGSSRQNLPRTFLTSISVESLMTLAAPSRDAISRAIAWFGHNQRPDGSWGPEPGQDGTVLHTAIAMSGLIAAGLPFSDPRILLGSSFLRDRWVPDARNFLQEVYDVNYTKGYSRVIVEHDVDAAVVRILLDIHPAWATEVLFGAIDGMIALYVKAGKTSPPYLRPSIWNILPRASTLDEFLLRLPFSDEGKIWYFKEGVTYTRQANSSERKYLANMIARHLIPTHWWAFAFLVFFLAVTIVILISYYRGTISGKELLLSLFVNLAVLSLGFFVDRKGWGKK